MTKAATKHRTSQARLKENADELRQQVVQLQIWVEAAARKIKADSDRIEALEQQTTTDRRRIDALEDMTNDLVDDLNRLEAEPWWRRPWW